MKILDIAFTCIVIVSVVSLAFQTNQYIEFNRLIQELEVNPVCIEPSIYGERVNVTVQIMIPNPSRYSAITTDRAELWLYYWGETHPEVLPWGPYVGQPYQKINTSWWYLAAEAQTYGNMPLAPESCLNLTLLFRVEQDRARKFLEQYQKNEPLKWWIRGVIVFNVNAYIDTLRLQVDSYYPYY